MLKELQIKLRDRDAELVSAWQRCFVGYEQVEISQGDIFGAVADAIVSPANSFGFMDGGIDLAYSNHFGWDLQDRLQAMIREQHDGELPVGQAVIVATNSPSIPFLISAPTMRIPMDVSNTLNAYLAFRAALRAVKSHNQMHPVPIRSILCPGLATAIGGMPLMKAARQMYAAYLIVALGMTDYLGRPNLILHNHQALMRGEPMRFE